MCVLYLPWPCTQVGQLKGIDRHSFDISRMGKCLHTAVYKVTQRHKINPITAERAISRPASCRTQFLMLRLLLTLSSSITDCMVAMKGGCLGRGASPHEGCFKANPHPSTINFITFVHTHKGSGLASKLTVFEWRKNASTLWSVTNYVQSRSRMSDHLDSLTVTGLKKKKDFFLYLSMFTINVYMNSDTLVSIVPI